MIGGQRSEVGGQKAEDGDGPKQGRRQADRSLRGAAGFRFSRAADRRFVDGCFWHGCPRYATYPKTNAAFWRKKLAANRARDRPSSRRRGTTARQVGWSLAPSGPAVGGSCASGSTSCTAGTKPDSSDGWPDSWMIADEFSQPGLSPPLSPSPARPTKAVAPQRHGGTEVQTEHPIPSSVSPDLRG